MQVKTVSFALHAQIGSDRNLKRPLRLYRLFLTIYLQQTRKFPSLSPSVTSICYLRHFKLKHRPYMAKNTLTAEHRFLLRSIPLIYTCLPTGKHCFKQNIFIKQSFQCFKLCSMTCLFCCLNPHIFIKCIFYLHLLF